MNFKELDEIIYKEVCEAVGCEELKEKSVPQPYDRYSAKKMTDSQIKRRDKIGKSMMANKKTSAKFKENFDDEWEDYLWAAATNIAMKQE